MFITSRATMLVALFGASVFGLWTASAPAGTHTVNNNWSETYNNSNTTRDRTVHVKRSYATVVTPGTPIYLAPPAVVQNNATVQVTTVNPPPVSSASQQASALYILSVGVNHNRLAPGKPADDHAPYAREVASELSRKSSGLYRQVHTRVLVGAQADRKGVLAGLDWLRRSMTPNDVAVIFITAHGGMAHGAFYHIGVAGFDAHRYVETALWGQEVREALLETPGRKVLFLCTCQAAGILGAPVVSTPLPNTEIICSTRPNESFGPAFAFDKALVRGLAGAAADANGHVTVGGLEHYLATSVVQTTNDKEHVTISRPLATGAPGSNLDRLVLAHR